MAFQQLQPQVLILRRHLLEQLGFRDVLPQPEVAAEDAALASHVESVQLTSPRSAPGASPPRPMPEANGNAFKEEGKLSHCETTSWRTMSTLLRHRCHDLSHFL